MDPTPNIDPSLLEYAQHFNIAEEPSSLTPESYLRESGIHDGFPPTVPRSIDSMQTRYEEFSSLFDPVFVNEKLDISKQEAHLLSVVRQLERDIPSPNWKAILPPLPGAISVRAELSLITQKEEERAQSLQKGDDIKMLEVTTSPGGNKSAGQELDKDISLVEEERHPHRDFEGLPVRIRVHRSIFQGESGGAVDSSVAGNKNHPVNPSSKLPQPQARVSQTGGPAASLNLGSLTTYMETRAVMTSPGTVTSSSTSPFFNQVQTPAAPETPLALPTTGSVPVLNILPAPTLPQGHSHSVEDLTLYFSSDLLKTHLPFVHDLEVMPKHPQIVYRDYNPEEGFEDADIIIPPATGIILTNMQALTQQSLPGDGFSDENPVMDRVRRLASRYQYFYVLVAGSETADRVLVNAVEDFKSFCEALSNNVVVSSLLVPFDMMAQWALALAFERYEEKCNEMQRVGPWGNRATDLMDGKPVPELQ